MRDASSPPSENLNSFDLYGIANYSLDVNFLMLNPE